MKKLFIAVVALFLVTTNTFAQEAAEKPNPSVLPMFGNIAKTEAQQIKDQKFLSSCDNSFSSRQEASEFFMNRGWEYFNEGQMDTAVYRFNLAWLLNPDNSNTYWAFGLVTYGQGKLNESIGFYEKALALDPTNSLIMSDIASSYLALQDAEEKKNKKKQAFKKVVEFTNKALAADSVNAFALYTMSKVKFQEKQYEEAWTYLHKGREQNVANIDFVYLTSLMAEMPDPTGFFKNN
ncbi:tetratricopeptide repeat protein [Pontibacter sp. 13R65]|uniref:tetratricopeptide repeat protein n=1 Tax=Pontibacter sp. 13R65 TaxID=3127458 RepID=UPI00301C01B7